MSMRRVLLFQHCFSSSYFFCQISQCAMATRTCNLCAYSWKWVPNKAVARMRWNAWTQFTQSWHKTHVRYQLNSVYRDELKQADVTHDASWKSLLIHSKKNLEWKFLKKMGKQIIIEDTDNLMKIDSFVTESAKIIQWYCTICYAN